jgi:CheY-like chemotaxis protein
MIPDARGSTPSPAAPSVRDLESRVSTDVEELVVFLDCAGRKTSDAYRSATALVARSPAGRGPLFLILRHLERIDGPITGFVLGLEAILRTSTRPVLLGDPSGVAPLVLASSERDRRIRPLSLPAGPGKVLIVIPSSAAAGLLAAVLEAFGRTCAVVHTGIDARAAIAAERFDAVLLDLDMPGLQGYGVAELLRAQARTTVPVALTGNDDVWNLETLVRYGFRRILTKPYSVAETAGLVAGATAGRGC